MKHCSHTGVIAWLTGVLAAVVLSLPLAAQPTDTSPSVNKLRVDASDVAVGVNGYIQPGQWAAMRVFINNPAPRAIPVICQWEMADVDGEKVVYEREYTLNESRIETVWLYGALTPVTDSNTIWRLRVLDAETREILTSLPVQVPEASLVPRQVRVVGVTGGVGMGLESYTVPAEESFGAWTQQEGTRFISSIKPEDLPDRWQGMDAMSALIWTPNGGDPDGAMSSATFEAIREWIRRGGHLVVILPSVGDLWTGSRMADLLPIDRTSTLSERPIPPWVGPAPNADLKLDVKRLQPRENATVLAMDLDDNPLVVTGRYGFGCVTVIGVDLTDTRLARANLPSGKWPIWRDIFGWQGPAYRDVMIDALVSNEKKMPRPMFRDHYDLDASFIPELIAMQGAASAPLLLAILLFFIYWITAGPVSFIVLKLKKKTRHAWNAFVALVALFSLIAWGGAWLLRPVEAQLEHFTFLDFAADTGLVRGRSWSTVLVPVHGDVAMVLEEANETSNRNLIAAQGMTVLGADAGYPDARTYATSSNAPYRVEVPFRSTAKQFSLAYLGTHAGPAADEPWEGPTGQLKIVNNWPDGTLVHNLPIALTDVRVVFSLGDGSSPWIWDIAEEWKAGERLPFTPPRSAQRLSIRPSDETVAWGGYLGESVRKPNVAGQQRLISFTTMLTLFDQLPPPIYLFKQDAGFLTTLNAGNDFNRTFARQVDMSALTSMPCVLLIAYAKESPLPLPLTVNGESLPSRGWTVVRCYYPLN